MDIETLKKFLQSEGAAEELYSQPVGLLVHEVALKFLEKKDPKAFLEKQKEQFQQQRAMLDAQIQDVQAQIVSIKPKE